MFFSLPFDAFSAKCGIAVISHPSFVCLSICLSVTLRHHGRIGWLSSKVITRIISLGLSLLGATNRRFKGGVTVLSRKPAMSLK